MEHEPDVCHPALHSKINCTHRAMYREEAVYQAIDLCNACEAHTAPCVFLVLHFPKHFITVNPAASTHRSC